MFAADGTVTTVIGLSPVLNEPLHRVCFCDGQVVEAGPNHLWRVSSNLARVANSTQRNRQRGDTRARYLADAERLRRLATSVPTGTLATAPTIADIAGCSATTVLGVVNPHMALPVDVPTSRMAKCYSGDNLHMYFRRAIDDGSPVTVSSMVVDGRLLADLSLVGRWMTARQLADRLYGFETPATIGSVNWLIGRARPESREVPVTHKWDGYPVDEVLGLLASAAQNRADAVGAATSPLESLFTTAEMVEAGIVYKEKQANFAVRAATRLELPEVGLPVDPYILGVWLGDGSRGKNEITAGHNDAQEMARLLGEAWPHAIQIRKEQRSCRLSLARDRKVCYYGHPVAEFETVKSGGGGREQKRCVMCQKQYVAAWNRGEEPLGKMVNPSLPHLLRRAGVFHDKHIPAIYLRASFHQRFALLQGLMDTDGSIDTRDRQCSFPQSDERLARQALELVRSLGIRATLTSGPSWYRNEAGKRVYCDTKYVVNFYTTLPVFRLPRKALFLPSSLRSTQEWRYITDIEVGKDVPMRCIAVDHPDHIYLTEHFIPTHNSVLGQSFLYGFVAKGARWCSRSSKGWR